MSDISDTVKHQQTQVLRLAEFLHHYGCHVDHSDGSCSFHAEEWTDERLYDRSKWKGKAERLVNVVNAISKAHKKDPVGDSKYLFQLLRLVDPKMSLEFINRL